VHVRVCDEAEKEASHALRWAFVGEGQSCNWKIHEQHFSDYVPILDFTHVVRYLFRASFACFGKGDEVSVDVHAVDDARLTRQDGRSDFGTEGPSITSWAISGGR